MLFCIIQWKSKITPTAARLYRKQTVMQRWGEAFTRRSKMPGCKWGNRAAKPSEPWEQLVLSEPRNKAALQRVSAVDFRSLELPLWKFLLLNCKFSLAAWLVGWGVRLLLCVMAMNGKKLCVTSEGALTCNFSSAQVPLVDKSHLPSHPSVQWARVPVCTGKLQHGNFHGPWSFPTR